MRCRCGFVEYTRAPRRTACYGVHLLELETVSMESDEDDGSTLVVQQCNDIMRLQEGLCSLLQEKVRLQLTYTQDLFLNPRAKRMQYDNSSSTVAAVTCLRKRWRH